MDWADKPLPFAFVTKILNFMELTWMFESPQLIQPSTYFQVRLNYHMVLTDDVLNKKSIFTHFPLQLCLLHDPRISNYPNNIKWKIQRSSSFLRGTRWRSWLRHCATSRKVAGAIPDGVIGIFHWHNPSGRTMALGLTQPLIEMSTRNILWWVKAADASGWPYHLHLPSVLKPGSLNLLEVSGPVQACSGTALLLSSPYLLFPDI
jgi:hypothetical protein